MGYVYKCPGYFSRWEIGGLSLVCALLTFQVGPCHRKCHNAPELNNALGLFFSSSQLIQIQSALRGSY